MITVGIHAGHALIGSVGAVGIIHESVWARKIKTEMVKYWRSQYKDLFKLQDNTITYAKTSREVLNAIKSKSKNCKYNYSIHLNAGGGNGTELLQLKTPTQAETDSFRKTVNTMGLKNRGIKIRNDLFVLNQLNNCKIIEVGFVDNQDDVKIIKKNYKIIAHAIMDWIVRDLLRKEVI